MSLRFVHASAAPQATRGLYLEGLHINNLHASQAVARNLTAGQLLPVHMWRVESDIKAFRCQKLGMDILGIIECAGQWFCRGGMSSSSSQC